jgi:hypothetical protein
VKRFVQVLAFNLRHTIYYYFFCATCATHAPLTSATGVLAAVASTGLLAVVAAASLVRETSLFPVYEYVILAELSGLGVGDSLHCSGGLALDPDSKLKCKVRSCQKIFSIDVVLVIDVENVINKIHELLYCLPAPLGSTVCGTENCLVLEKL